MRIGWGDDPACQGGTVLAVLDEEDFYGKGCVDIVCVLQEEVEFG